jgi:serine/threonine-protein kinase
MPQAPEAAGTPTQLNADDTALPPPSPPEKNVTIIGDFHLLKTLGEGAMGKVYKAYQPAFKRHVALKILFEHVAKNPKLVERLYREGLVMGRLDHPNIVAAYGTGEDKGWHYIAMEYVDGEALQKWLNRVGSVAVGDALHVILACARALQYAHENGLVHRDVKPDNVLITREGLVKVADLGMVKTSDEDMALTQTGHAVGTPWYMPLEQARNAKNIDARSDIYALGCMLYCLLTGEPPFAGKTLVEVIQAKEIGTFPPARSVNNEVPERLDLIITKMTAKLPRYRYQSCAEVINDLEALNLASAELAFLTAPARSGEAPKRLDHDRAAVVGRLRRGQARGDLVSALQDSGRSDGHPQVDRPQDPQIARRQILRSDRSGQPQVDGRLPRPGHLQGIRNRRA